MFSNCSTLAGIHLSRNLKRPLLLQSDSPMAQAVKLWSQLMDLGYRVLLMSPHYMQIASPDRPRRFQGYHIDQAQRLLERQYE